MDKLDFERMINPLSDIISDIENDMLVDIINRIDNYDGVKGSLKWYTDKLTELKLLDKNSKKIFENNKKYLERVIKDIAENCGYKVDNLDKLQEYFKNGKIDINPMTLFESTSINKMINEAIKDTNNIMNLIQTKAIEGTNKAYKDILNKAYIEISSGIYTYTESIRRALDSYGKTGIKAAHYESGGTLSIESVVRRDVITRMNKLVGDTELEHAKDLGTNLVYVDQHLGARVRTKYTKNDYEAHDEWQGKKYMIDGSSEKYPNLKEVTGYGEMLGLKGLNCYHNMRPTWEWEKIDDKLDSLKNKRVKDLADNMRAYERKIRELKRRKNIAKETNDINELKKINIKQKEINAKYNDWLKENKLTRDYNREYVSLNKNKILFYNKTNILESTNGVYKAYEENNNENLLVINKNGEKLGEINTINSSSSVGYSEEQKALMKGHNRDLIAIHNHPQNHTFSLQDIKETFNSKALSGIIVTTDDYNYYFFPKMSDMNMNEIQLKYFMNWLEKEMANCNDKMFEKFPKLSNNEHNHLSFEEIFKKLEWNYGRERKK